jgi:branched-chain amino acid transport system ATP-binding protein
VLKVDNVSSGYGPVEILHSVSLTVNAGEVVALIGVNGAGKSTLFRTISSLIRCRSGKITFLGQDITRLAAHAIVAMGIVQVAEGRQVFAAHTVYENLLLGCYSKYRVLGSKGRQHLLDSVLEIFPALAGRKYQIAGTLSGGEQQMLVIGRALMAQPKLLLLDEPSSGLAPIIIENIFRVIKELNILGLPILLIEQVAPPALRLANRGYIIETGRVVLEDRANKLINNELVRKAYLGEAGLEERD